MKFLRSALLMFLFPLLAGAVHGQGTRPPGPPPPRVKQGYLSGGGEIIFSQAVLDLPDVPAGAGDPLSVVRFTPYFNAAFHANYDLTAHFGVFGGLALHNVGFIMGLGDSLRYKYRMYSLGIPVGLKLGTMNAGLLFAGYEPMFALNYKEKKFVNEKKEDKFNVWFSDRTPLVHHTLFLGYQFRNGLTLTVKYFLTNFHNTDFKETKDGVTTQPYHGLNANVVCFSIGLGLFQEDSITRNGTARPDPQASLD